MNVFDEFETAHALYFSLTISLISFTLNHTVSIGLFTLIPGKFLKFCSETPPTRQFSFVQDFIFQKVDFPYPKLYIFCSLEWDPIEKRIKSGIVILYMRIGTCDSGLKIFL